MKPGLHRVSPKENAKACLFVSPLCALLLARVQQYRGPCLGSSYNAAGQSQATSSFFFGKSMTDSQLTYSRKLLSHRRIKKVQSQTLLLHHEVMVPPTKGHICHHASGTRRQAQSGLPCREVRQEGAQVSQLHSLCSGNFHIISGRNSCSQ